MAHEIKICMGSACFAKGNQENLEFIKAKNNKQIIAVIKSNSYGLGIVEIAKYLSSLMIDFFAVST